VWCCEKEDGPNSASQFGMFLVILSKDVCLDKRKRSVHYVKTSVITHFLDYETTHGVSNEYDRATLI
jgi:hypothetical protein